MDKAGLSYLNPCFAKDSVTESGPQALEGLRRLLVMLSETQLKDLESRVHEEPGGPGYFAEAIRNFRSKSYMSCVVMLSNAVHAYAYRRLEHAVSVDHSYWQVLDNINRLSKNEEAYETPLANGLRGAGLISEEKYRYLEELRSVRNRVAHPLGAIISDYDAATLLDRGVTLFLAEWNLDPLVTVEEVINRLKQPGYFPRDDQDAKLMIIKSEIDLIPVKAYPRLIEQILKAFRGRDDSVIANGIAFLRLCASLKENEDLAEALLRKLIRPKLDRKVTNPDPHMATIVAVIERWPESTVQLTEVERMRLDARLCEFFTNCLTPDEHLTRAVSMASRLSASELPTRFDSYSNVKKALSRSLVVGLALLSNNETAPKARYSIVRNYAQRARSAERSSDFAGFVDLNGIHLAEVLKGEEACRLLAALEQRRMAGPRSQNLGRTGDFLIHPSKFQDSVLDPCLDRFESLLKAKVLDWIRLDREGAERVLRRQRFRAPTDFQDQVVCLPPAPVRDWSDDRRSQMDTIR